MESPELLLDLYFNLLDTLLSGTLGIEFFLLVILIWIALCLPPSAPTPSGGAVSGEAPMPPDSVVDDVTAEVTGERDVIIVADTVYVQGTSLDMADSSDDKDVDSE